MSATGVPSLQSLSVVQPLLTISHLFAVVSQLVTSAEFVRLSDGQPPSWLAASTVHCAEYAQRLFVQLHVPVPHPPSVQ
jgi:hypothetical protein